MHGIKIISGGTKKLQYNVELLRAVTVRTYVERWLQDSHTGDKMGQGQITMALPFSQASSGPFSCLFFSPSQKRTHHSSPQAT